MQITDADRVRDLLDRLFESPPSQHGLEKAGWHHGPSIPLTCDSKYCAAFVV
jgi:hypothetical protein